MVKADINRTGYGTGKNWRKEWESYEICSVPGKNDYRSFLKHKVEDLEDRVAGGNSPSPVMEWLVGQHAKAILSTLQSTAQRTGIALVNLKRFRLRSFPESRRQVMLLVKSRRVEEVKQWYVRLTWLGDNIYWNQWIMWITKIRYKDAVC